MRRLFGFGLAAVLILSSAPLGPAQAEEPDWYPLKSITPEVIQSIVLAFTRPHRELNDEDLRQLRERTHHPVQYPAFDEKPVVSLWQTPVNIWLSAAQGDRSHRVQVENIMFQLTSFLTEVGPVPIKIVFTNPDLSNLLVGFLGNSGDRDPGRENAFAGWGRIESEYFPVPCGVVCRAERLENREHADWFTTADVELYQNCCRIVEHDGQIIGGLFYNSRHLPIPQGEIGVPLVSSPLKGKANLTNEDVAGEVRRLLYSLVLGLGFRYSLIGDISNETTLSPIETEIKHREQLDAYHFYPESASTYAASSGWDRIARATRVCELTPQAPQPDQANPPVRLEMNAYAPDCLFLHRVAAEWRLLALAGVHSGMSPREAREMLADYVNSHR